MIKLQEESKKLETVQGKKGGLELSDVDCSLNLKPLLD
jgi:hypothetical protein